MSVVESQAPQVGERSCYFAAGQEIGSALEALKSRYFNEPDQVQREVVRLYESLQRDPPSDTRSHGLLLCAFLIADCTLQLREVAQAERWARLAVSHIVPTTPMPLRSRAHNALGAALLTVERHAEAIGHLRNARETAGASDDVPLQVKTANNLGGLLMLLGAHDEAIDVLTSAWRLVGRRARDETLLPTSGLVLGNLAAAHIDRALKSSCEVDGADLAGSSRARRDLVLARRFARGSISIARHRKSTSDEGFAVLNLADAEVLQGCSARVEPWLSSLSRRINHGEGKSALQLAAVRVALAQGRSADAAELYAPLQSWRADGAGSLHESYLVAELQLRRVQERWQDACRAMAELEARRRARYDGTALELAVMASARHRRNDQRLIAFLAHDLRAPLQSLATLAGRPHERDQIADLTHRAVRDIDHTIDSLQRDDTDLSRPAAVLNLFDAMAAAQRSVVGDARAAGVHVEIGGSRDAWVEGRLDALERALVNLLLNAISVSRPRQVVHARIEQSHAGLCVRVVDAGPGLTADEDAMQASRHGAHFGLGLDFVQRVAAAHRGAFRLLPGPEGRGAMAELTLPRA
jgi:signal transduction histidine kinase